MNEPNNLAVICNVDLSLQTVEVGLLKPRGCFVRNATKKKCLRGV